VLALVLLSMLWMPAGKGLGLLRTGGMDTGECHPLLLYGYTGQGQLPYAGCLLPAPAAAAARIQEMRSFGTQLLHALRQA